MKHLLFTIFFPLAIYSEDYSTVRGLSAGYIFLGSDQGETVSGIDIHGCLMFIAGGIDFVEFSDESESREKIQYYIGPSIIGCIDLSLGGGNGTSYRIRGNFGINPFSDNISSMIDLGYPSTKSGNYRNFRTAIISPMIEYNDRYDELMYGLSVNLVFF